MPIVSAVGQASNQSGRKGALGRKVEEAMAAAAAEALANGITDNAEVRTRMLAARDAVKAQQEKSPMKE